jgi:hypothetical protein
MTGPAAALTAAPLQAATSAAAAASSTRQPVQNWVSQAHAPSLMHEVYVGKPGCSSPQLRSMLQLNPKALLVLAARGHSFKTPITKSHNTTL